VVFADQALAVVEDDLPLLHGLLRREATVGFAQAHGAPGKHGAHAQFAHRINLHVDGIFQAVGEQVVVVGGGGAAREQQFGQGDFGGQSKFLGRQTRPHRVQGFQPGEQRLIDHRRPGTGEGLVKMMVGVDQAGQDHVFACVEHLSTRHSGLFSPAQHFGDHTVLLHQAATGIKAIGSENREGVF